ncbi:MAG TPA: HAD family phosphatase [Polyangiaceae bacterium]|nr:HAD family phosphatase [Polyangiaceae bacterium]
MSDSLNDLSLKAVLFDYGKVLTRPERVESWNGMRDLLGLSEENFREMYWKYRDHYDRGTLSGTEYWSNIARDVSFPLQESSLVELKKLDVEMWTEPNPPMVEWAHRLKSAGLKIGILSNIGDAMEQGVREKFAWVETFTHVTWSHALKMRKPEREIYAAAAKGLGVEPGEVLFIDDREDNIAGARAAGMRGVVYAVHAEFEREMARIGLGALLRV